MSAPPVPEGGAVAPIALLGLAVSPEHDWQLEPCSASTRDAETCDGATPLRVSFVLEGAGELEPGDVKVGGEDRISYAICPACLVGVVDRLIELAEAGDGDALRAGPRGLRRGD